MPESIARILPTDPSYAKLTDFARRLETLLNKPKVKTNVHAQSTLDFLLGALYGLSLAALDGYEHRPKGKKPDFEPLVNRTALLVKGEVRLDGKWMAGFHFNSALFRLAAIYHRTLKVVTKNTDTDKSVGDLMDELREKHKGWAGRWTNRNIQKLHEEVNDWKHAAQGRYEGRDVNPGHAFGATEELLTLWEAWPGLR